MLQLLFQFIHMRNDADQATFLLQLDQGPHGHVERFTIEGILSYLNHSGTFDRLP
jgi:hypothetical protein